MRLIPAAEKLKRRLEFFKKHSDGLPSLTKNQAFLEFVVKFPWIKPHQCSIGAVCMFTELIAPEYNSVTYKTTASIATWLHLNEHSSRLCESIHTPKYILSKDVYDYWADTDVPVNYSTEEILKCMRPAVMLTDDRYICIIPNQSVVDERPEFLVYTEVFNKEGDYRFFKIAATSYTADFKTEGVELDVNEVKTYGDLLAVFGLTKTVRNVQDLDLVNDIIPLRVAVNLCTFLAGKGVAPARIEANLDRVAEEKVIAERAARGRKSPAPSHQSIKYIDIDETMVRYINSRADKRKKSDGTGSKKAAHLRRNHWHSYWIGKGDERVLVPKWLPDIFVQGDLTKEKFIMLIRKQKIDRTSVTE